MRHVLALVILLGTGAASWAQPSPFGYWRTADGDGVINVTPCDGKLCATLAGIVLDHPTDATPTDYRGVSQCDLPLVSDAAPVGPNLWRGHITDPRNGKVYGAELHVDDQGRLALRGFLGVPLLGRTDYWTRFPAVPPADCRMTEPPTTQAADGRHGAPG